MRVDPESVLEFGRSVWRASDGVAEIRGDTTLSAAASGMSGSDLSHVLRLYPDRQQRFVGNLAFGLNDDLQRAGRPQTSKSRGLVTHSRSGIPGEQ